MAAIGIASMALGAAGSIFGGISARKAAKKAQKIRRNQQEKEDAWYLRRYNEHYADTAAGQQLLTSAKDYARDNFQRTQGAAAVGGGSTAATAAAKEGGNKVVGQTLGNMAANDTARKDRIDALHHNAQQENAEQNAQTEVNRANQINAAATQAGNALIQGGAAMLQDSGSSKNTQVPTEAPNAGEVGSTGGDSNVRTEGIPNANVPAAQTVVPDSAGEFWQGMYGKH